jgi:hypothetical protein
VIYVRQSSDGQVKNNLESQQLQYALAPRAKGLGFGDVEILDVDLGASAAVAAKRRDGFERLLGAVALGEVGLILSRELSRLLRTDKDFCQLVELCQLFDTLLGDEQTIYDVSRMDDQLVLGIKRPDSYSTSYSSSRGRISLLRDPPRITQLCVGKRRLNGREIPNVGTRDRRRRMRPLDEWRSISDTFRRPPWHSPEGGPCLGPSRRGGRCTRQFAT